MIAAIFFAVVLSSVHIISIAWLVYEYVREQYVDNEVVGSVIIINVFAILIDVPVVAYIINCMNPY